MISFENPQIKNLQKNHYLKQACTRRILLNYYVEKQGNAINRCFQTSANFLEINLFFKLGSKECLGESNLVAI